MEKVILKKFVFRLPAEWEAGDIVLWAVDYGTARHMFTKMYWTDGKHRAMFLGSN